MIKFKQVTKQFSDGTVAFRDLSFTVDEGEMALITGPSGSGKTTIMRLLIREYVPTRGEIVFEDTNIEQIRGGQIPQLRRKVGVVFQDYKLISELNVWENIALPLYIKNQKQEDIEDRVTDLLKLVELTDKGLMFPKQLSGGEAQRISIARALATAPRVIFADEPTGNLDKDASRHVITLLRKINELGTTTVIATHDPLVIDQLQVKKVDLGVHNTTKAPDSQPVETEEEEEKIEKKRKERIQKEIKKQETESKKSRAKKIDSKESSRDSSASKSKKRPQLENLKNTSAGLMQELQSRFKNIKFGKNSKDEKTADNTDSEKDSHSKENESSTNNQSTT